MARILIVDDDLSLQTSLELYFSAQGHEIYKASNGLQGLEMTKALKPEIIILDIIMPKMNGLEVCKKIKEKINIPIIFLSAKDSAEDRIKGLEAGADDYVTKPFSLKELELRINARLKQSDANKERKRLVFNDLVIDYNQKQAFLKGTLINLTPMEFELIWHLASQPNNLFSHKELMAKLWENPEKVNPNLLHVYIRRLRNKIESNPKKAKYILNVWGQGYIFKA